MTPKFRAWFGSEMYDNPVVCDGELYLDWREFENGETYNGAVLMQSTMLKDKNGKEIFEGDVVKYAIGRNTYTEEVVYDKNFAGFGVKDADADIIFSFEELAEDVDLSSLEVVGNICENPELLDMQERQKPKVPQVVAAWYEEYKNYFEYNLYSLCVDFHERKLQEDLHGWFNRLDNKPIETLVMMHKFGYEVDEEVEECNQER